MRDARGTSKSCPRHSGTNSNTSVLNQSIVGGRPDSVQVDSPPRQRLCAYVRNRRNIFDGRIRKEGASKPRTRAYACPWEPFDESSTISHPPSRSLPQLLFPPLLREYHRSASEGEKEGERSLHLAPEDSATK